MPVRYDRGMTRRNWVYAPADAPEPPEDYLGLVRAFRAGLTDVLGDGLASFYLHGAVAFPRPASWRLDLDFTVLLSRMPTEEERDAIQALHGRLEREWPLGDEADGYYVLLADAGERPPPPCRVWPNTFASWALHRAHVLADRFRLGDGLDPRDVLVTPDWPELRADLAEELRFVLDQPEYPAYGILNAARILRSVREREVVSSKAAAAAWVERELPEWSPAFAAAVRSYGGRERDGDDMLLAEAFPEFLDLVQTETGLLPAD